MSEDLAILAALLGCLGVCVAAWAAVAGVIAAIAHLIGVFPVTAYLIAAMADLVICLLAAITYLIVRDGRAAAVAQAPRGRHYENTVEMVAGDYWPAVGARRIALLTDTQYDMQAVDA